MDTGCFVIDRLPELDRGELCRRLPEIDQIDGSLKRQVRTVFLDHCPEYFWWVPASSSGNHHPKDTRGIHGLWLHVRRTFVIYERVQRSFLEQDLIDRWEANCGRAAILLHDLFKYGQLSKWQEQRIISCLRENRCLPDRDFAHTVTDHDVLAAEYLDDHTDLPDRVIDCIDSHNGPWYEGSTPTSSLEQLHHLADMIASEPGVYVDLETVPEELEPVIALDIEDDD